MAPKLTQAIAKVPKRIEDALNTFETTLGGREKVLSSLFALPPTNEIDYVVGLIADPRNDDLSLAQICAIGGISIGKLLAFWKDASGMKAQLEAIDKISRYLPDVVEDVMKRSLPMEEPCYRCETTGKVESPKAGGGTETVICFKCQGSGKLITAPNLETQKVAIQLGGFLKQGPSVSINTQFNKQENNAYFSRDDFQSFRSASDKLLFPGKERVTPQLEYEEEPADAEIISPIKPE